MLCLCNSVTIFFNLQFASERYKSFVYFKSESDSLKTGTVKKKHDKWCSLINNIHDSWSLVRSLPLSVQGTCHCSFFNKKCGFCQSSMLWAASWDNDHMSAQQFINSWLRGFLLSASLIICSLTGPVLG